MKIVIFVLVCFAIFFAVNRLYALYCNQLLKKTYFALESKNLKDAKKYAKRIIKTALKAHGYEVLGEISQAEEDHLCAIPGGHSKSPTCGHLKIPHLHAVFKA